MKKANSNPLGQKYKKKIRNILPNYLNSLKNTPKKMQRMEFVTILAPSSSTSSSIPMFANWSIRSDDVADNTSEYRFSAILNAPKVDMLSKTPL
jgi:hypothetical protein